MCVHMCVVCVVCWCVHACVRCEKMEGEAVLQLENFAQEIDYDYPDKD